MYPLSPCTCCTARRSRDCRARRSRACSTPCPGSAEKRSEYCPNCQAETVALGAAKLVPCSLGVAEILPLSPRRSRLYPPTPDSSGKPAGCAAPEDLERIAGLGPKKILIIPI